MNISKSKLKMKLEKYMVINVLTYRINIARLACNSLVNEKQ